jgi:3-deoxy-7-phosphoheptulonate synthase
LSVRYLCRDIGENIYGKSITDACLGWEDTEKLINYIAENVKLKAGK